MKIFTAAYALASVSLGFGFAEERARCEPRPRRKPAIHPAIAEIYAGAGTSKLLPPAPPKPLSKRARRRARGKAKVAQRRQA